MQDLTKKASYIYITFAIKGDTDLGHYVIDLQDKSINLSSYMRSLLTKDMNEHRD